MSKLRRVSAGFTLVEAMIALLVLVIGGMGTIAMLKNSVETGRQIDGKSNGLMLVSRFGAEVQNARLLSLTDRDPHLALGTYDELTTHVNTSVVQTFGYLSKDLGPVTLASVPTYRLAYEVRACGECGALGGVEILITLNNVASDGALLRPQQFVIRREHNQSFSGSNPRGY